MVVSLAKLHNFCLDEWLNHENNTTINRNVVVDNLLIQDVEHITMNEHGSVPLVFDLDSETNIPDDLIGGGEHFDDVPRYWRRGVSDDTAHTLLCIHVENSHKRRPKVNPPHGD